MKSKFFDHNLLPLKNFSFNVILYGFGYFIQKLISLTLIFILVREINIESFGLYDLFMTIIMLVYLLISFGQDTAIARFINENKDNLNIKKVISESFALQSAMILMISIIGYFLVNFNKYFNYDQNIKIIINNVLLLTPFYFFVNFSLNILKWRFKRFQYNILLIASILFILILILFLSLNDNLTLNKIFYTYIIVYFILSIYSYFLIKEYLILSFKFEFIFKLLKFGYPFGIISIVVALSALFERYFILYFLDYEKLGLYSFSVKISFIVHLFVHSFHMGWGPTAYSKFNEKDFDLFFNLIFKIYVIISLSILSLLTFFSEYLILYIGGVNYIETRNLIFPICLSFVLLGLIEILGIGIIIAKKTIYSLYSYFFYFITLIVLMYYFIKFYDILGIAWGLVIASFLLLSIEAIISHKVYKIKYEYFIVLLFSIFFILLNIFLFYNPLFIISFYINYFLILIFNILLFISGILFLMNKNERRLIFKLIQI